MSDPVRLLDPKGGAPLARTLLRAGLDASEGGEGRGFDPPPGAKEEVWGSLSSAIGIAALGATSTAPGATASAAKPVASLAVKSGAKLVLGKWFLLSTFAIGAIGGVAYTASSRRAAPAVSDARTGRSQPTGDRPSSGDPRARDVEVSADDVVEPAPGMAEAASPRAPAPADAVPLESAPGDPPRGSAANGKDGPNVPTSVPLTATGSRAGAPRSGTPAVDAPSEPEAAPTSALFKESTALTDARKKLRSGDTRGTLAALGDMQQRFGGGGMEQERLALLVEAVAASGDTKKAAQLADSFLASYPQSPLGDRVRPYASH